MLAAIRPMGLSLKVYAIALSAAAAASFVAGGTANFIYARNHPGADPYMRAPVTQSAPAPVAAPVTAQPAPLLQLNDAADDDEAIPVAGMVGRGAVARREPVRCIDQNAPDGRNLGKLCYRDPGGVENSATGAVMKR